MVSKLLAGSGEQDINENFWAVQGTLQPIPSFPIQICFDKWVLIHSSQGSILFDKLLWVDFNILKEIGK